MAAVAAWLIPLWRKRRTALNTNSVDVIVAEEEASDSEELMRSICELMEREHLYLNNKLKLSDVAERLGSNRNSISACINNQLNCSFSQFIGKYRVEYAQQLMRNKPDMKTTEVWMQSGFTTEVSFFRTFKAFTGMTPNEWRACGEQ